MVIARHLPPRLPLVRAGLAGLALMGALTITASARAQRAKPSPSASEASEADGRARFAEGIKLVEVGDHERARLKFSQAWAVLKSPPILFNLARAEQLSGHFVEALQHYREFDRLSDPSVAPIHREQAMMNITELTKKVAHLRIEAPPNARVFVDGAQVTDFSDPVPVLPGKRLVETTHPNGQTDRIEVRCEAGVVTKVPRPRIELLALELDRPEPVKKQPHMPEASSPSVDEPGSSASADERSTSGWVVPIVLASAGVVGLGMGIGFSVASQSSQERASELKHPSVCADPSSPACKEYTEAYDSAHMQNTLAWVGGIGGGALIVGALATYIFWPTTSSSSSAVRVLPTVGPRVAGAQASFRF